jgi:hypothetical protein
VLTENDVIDAVCAHLAAAGYEIIQRSYTDAKGIDIVARHPQAARRLLIEAKGETSSDPRTKRYGRPFDSAQVSVHIREAFGTAAKLKTETHGLGDAVAIALPETVLHHRYLNRIKSALDSLGIVVYFVQPDRSVKQG